MWFRGAGGRGAQVADDERNGEEHAAGNDEMMVKMKIEQQEVV